MISTFDVAILGTGTMGSATAYFLAKAGFKVIAFEQFRIVHDMGSHSGSTRIIRHAYHESPDYVPLIIRSDELWRQLEQQTGKKLLIRTGGIDLGPRNGPVVENALLACRTYMLPHEYLQADELMRRWPQFNVPDDWHACLDPNMGFLVVNECIRAYAEAARDLGAELHEEESVLEYSCNGSIRIKTSKAEYDTAKLVICGGAWNSKILSELNLPLTVKRKTLVWLQTNHPEQFQPGRFPIFLADLKIGLLYGFPLFGSTALKIANHNSFGAAEDPDRVDREFHAEDAKDAREFAAKYLKGVSANLIEGKICLYTLTPDEDFIIDLHPGNQNIAIAAGFSGHGFKFAPVVGEILTDLILKGKTDHPITKFRMERRL